MENRFHMTAPTQDKKNADTNRTKVARNSPRTRADANRGATADVRLIGGTKWGREHAENLKACETMFFQQRHRPLAD